MDRLRCHHHVDTGIGEGQAAHAGVEVRRVVDDIEEEVPDDAADHERGHDDVGCFWRGRRAQHRSPGLDAALADLRGAQSEKHLRAGLGGHQLRRRTPAPTAHAAAPGGWGATCGAAPHDSRSSLCYTRG